MRTPFRRQTKLIRTKWPRNEEDDERSTDEKKAGGEIPQNLVNGGMSENSKNEYATVEGNVFKNNKEVTTMEKKRRTERSKQLWLKEGDQNSKFFHTAAKTRKITNLIKSLVNDEGREVDWESGLQDTMISYFQNLFKATEIDWDEVVNCISSTITAEDNENLLRPVEIMEFNKALFNMHPDKSPGPDGLSPGFYQKYWSIVGNYIIKLVQEFFTTGVLLDQLTDTNIVSMPKKQHPSRIADLRLISLCNVTYKIISKVLANRFTCVVNILISETQSAFIPGHLIMDNIMIAYMMHYMKRKTSGNKGWMALKLDMSKAYNRVEWSYLKAVLCNMGFDDNPCVLSDNASLMNKPVSSLMVTWEREWDVDLIHDMFEAHNVNLILSIPLSNNDVDSRYWKKEKLGFYSVKLAYVLIQEGKTMQSTEGKKDVIYSATLPLHNEFERRPWVNSGFNCVSTGLGMIDLNENSTSSSWSPYYGDKKLLNGQNYNGILKKTEDGGLGFKKLREFNVAMLAKQAWRIVNEVNPLVTKVMRARYFAGSNFLEAKLGNNPSYVWRSLMETQEVIRQGCRRRIGTGQNTKIGRVPWLPCQTNGCITSEIPDSLNDAQVSSLFAEQGGNWDDDVIRDIFNDRDYELIRQIPISSCAKQDSWYWCFDSKGQFSVKDCYRRLIGEAVCSEKVFWKSLAKEVWSSVRLTELGQVLPDESVMEVLKRVFKNGTGDQKGMVAMLCWNLWHRMNEWVWKRVNTSVFGIQSRAVSMTVEWARAKEMTDKSYCGPESRANKNKGTDHGLVDFPNGDSEKVRAYGEKNSAWDALQNLLTREVDSALSGNKVEHFGNSTTMDLGYEKGATRKTTANDSFIVSNRAEG
ncbi:hypothetical protein AgCh_024858 [Apium graveolens]